MIRIPDSLYERLQKHATPFVDTPATVIERLLDAYETNKPRSNRATTQPTSALPAMGANSPFDEESPTDPLEDAPLRVPVIHKTGARYTVEGYGGLCEFLRGLGNAGWNPSKVRELLRKCPGGEAVSDSTIQCQVGAGKQARNGVPAKKRHHSGEPMLLTAEQLSALTALIGEG